MSWLIAWTEQNGFSISISDSTSACDENWSQVLRSIFPQRIFSTDPIFVATRSSATAPNYALLPVHNSC
jgi:hypothetical protein